MKKQRLLNTYVNNLSMSETISEIEKMIACEKKSYIVAINVDVVMKIEHDPYLKKITDNADMVLVDGKPLIWVSKIHKNPVKAKISGSDLVPLLCAEAAHNGYSMFIIGGKEGIAEKALDSVNELLETKYGIMILQPAYTRYHLELGEITSYPPGYKENAGIFCHNNPWISIAETVLGRGNRAFEVYRKICPSYIEEISDIHRTEPYVYSQMIAGADAPGFGEAKNSWLTGTAAWTFINLSQALLGILPGYDGLIVDPCLPETFGDFKVNRHFRGADYHIEIHKPTGVQKGVRWIELDGQKITGNQIPLVPGKKE